jgi:predicted kinase
VADADRPDLPGARAPRLYVLVGLPGSGKSTYARGELQGVARVSLDDLRMMMSGVAYDARYEPLVAEAAAATLEALLRRACEWGCDLVFDATNVTREHRQRAVQAARRHGVEPCCVFLDLPLEVALTRNQQREHVVPEEIVRRFHERLEPPTADEGFAEVRIVRP